VAGVFDRLSTVRGVGAVQALRAAAAGEIPGMSSTLLRCVMLSAIAAVASTAEVRVERLPSGGVQPQVAVDDAGVAHLVYLGGAEGGCDVWHLARGAGAAAEPQRVDSTAGSAVMLGTIRGARIALGREGRLHVLWNGNDGKHLWYARSAPKAGAFEPQRDLLQRTSGLDGGSAIAADASGRVSAVWHAHVPGAAAGEGNRAVFVAASSDDGASFAPEAEAWQTATGACGCCSAAAGYGADARLSILYRSASDGGQQRDMFLLTAGKGRPLAGTRLHRWATPGCPMSTSALVPTARGQQLAWETAGQIWIAGLDAASGRAEQPIPVPGEAGKRKHPALAVNQRGELLVAWDEGTGWKKGGSVAWQAFAADGRPEGEIGRRDDLPVWDAPAVYADQDGVFHLVY
jgi:hypothetical protein